MAIYKVSRTDSVDYDEYDAIIVRAPTIAAALDIATAPYSTDPDDWGYGHGQYEGFRTDGSNLKVEQVDVAGKSGVILGSFNAG